MPQMTREFHPQSPEHKQIVSMLQTRLKFALTKQKSSSAAEKWRQAENTMLAYVKESELDAVRRVSRENGTPRYTTISLPYSYALVMAAHTYATSVFFARDPIHQFKGRHGESEQATQAVEALIAYQTSVGGFMAPYYIWLYDAFKYGIGILGTYWEREVNHYTTLQPGEDGALLQQTNEVVAYEGNRVYNVSPFDFIPDPRVPIGRFQDGEFCAVRRRSSWNDLVRRERAGYITNLKFVKTGVGTSDTNSDESELERPDNDVWLAGDGEKHPAVVHCFEAYVELIPQEWGLSPQTYPETWVFTLTQDYSVLLGCSPLGAAHNQYPFDILESEVEGYGLFTRGIPEIMAPIQQTMDWLINSHFFNVRAALNNLFVADPSKIVLRDFENSEPGGIIRLRPEAYGLDLRSFFHQVPITDHTAQNMNDLQGVHSIGERIIGINDAILGAAPSGGRKTATEVRTATGFGVNRLKTSTEYMSATGFSRHSHKLVSNSQQYYSGERKFRIVGNLAQEAGNAFIDVRQESLTGFFDFVPVDGTLPIDRFQQANLWKEILLGLRNIPQVGMQYDIGRIFAWMASLAGLKNINQFRIQLQPDAALQAAAQAGNVVPVGGGPSPSGSGSAALPTNLPGLVQ